MALEEPASGPPPEMETDTAASPRIRRAIALPLSDDDQGAAASAAVAASAPMAVAVPAPVAPPSAAQPTSSVRAGGALAGRLFRSDTWRPQSATPAVPAVPASAEAATGATGEAVLTGSLAAAAAEGRTRKPSQTAAAAHGVKPGTWPALAAAALAGAVLVSVPLVHRDNKTRTDYEGLGHSSPVTGLNPDGANSASSEPGPDGYASEMPVHDPSDGTSTPLVPQPEVGAQPTRPAHGARAGKTETAVVPGTGTGTGTGSGTSTHTLPGTGPLPGAAPAPGTAGVPGTADVPGTAGIPGTKGEAQPGYPSTTGESLFDVNGGSSAPTTGVLPEVTPSVRTGIPFAPPAHHPPTGGSGSHAAKTVPTTKPRTKPTTRPATKPTAPPRHDPAHAQQGAPKADSKFPVLTFGAKTEDHKAAAKSATKPATPKPATPKAEPKSPVKKTSSPLSPAVPATKATPRTSAAVPGTPGKPTVPAKSTTPSKPSNVESAAPKSTDTATNTASPDPNSTGSTDSTSTDAQPSSGASPSATKDTPAPQTDSGASDSNSRNTKVIQSTYVLKSGQSVASNRMRITMRHHGDLVISDENGDVRWSSHTEGSHNYAVFQDDGHFVVYSHHGDTLWSSGTAGNPGAELVIKDDGNVVIQSTSGETLWASGTDD